MTDLRVIFILSVYLDAALQDDDEYSRECAQALARTIQIVTQYGNFDEQVVVEQAIERDDRESS